MDETQNQTTPSPNDTGEGIRGWLFVLAIVICMIPIKLILAINTLFLSPDVQSMFYIFGSSESALYIPWFRALLTIEFFGNLFFLFAGLGLIVLFFKKHILFPRMFFIFLLSNIIFLVTDALLSQTFDIQLGSEDISALYKEVIQTTISGIIWGSYIYKSKRVKNTFINRDFSHKTIFAKVVIIIVCISLGVKLSYLNFNVLTQGRDPETILTGTQIPIGTGAFLNGELYQVSPYNDITDKESNTLGLMGEKGNPILIHDEEIDSDTADILDSMNEQELFESSKSVFEENLGIQISTGSIEHIGDQTYFTYVGNADVEGQNFHYFIGYTFHGTQGINFYTYGYHQDIVINEGKKILQSITLQKK